MGDFTSAFLPEDDRAAGTTTAPTIPPQVLARWAALASQRAYLGSIPQQVRA